MNSVAPNKNTHVICYISNAVTLLNSEEMDLLFAQTVINNERQGTTGILIYREGTFIQVL